MYLRVLKPWLPTLVWLIVIFFFSSRPTMQASTIDLGDFLLKKSAHFIEYFILACLLFRSLKLSFNFSLSKTLILGLLLAVLYAASDEYHQSFVAGREPALRDVLIDSVGAGFASLLIYRFPKLQETIG